MKRPKLDNSTADNWPLFVVLMLQATATLWVTIMSNGPSNDEALYLSVGHLEVSHLLRGTVTPAVSHYFSGAPVLYPPLGAVAYSLGGLDGARTLSLAFMLGATALLWAVTSRLFSRQAAVCATAMFGLLAPVLHLGSLATYDAMSLFFLALAGWCALRPYWRWLALAGIAVVLANAVKYASALFDPVIIAIAAAAYWDQSGSAKRAVGRAVALAAGIIVAIAGFLLIAGPGYWLGIRVTTLTRRSGMDATSLVLTHAMSWGWIVLVLAIAGVIISRFQHQSRTRSALFAVLAAAGFLAPVEQARIHTLLSLNKHLAFGAWFAAAPAGYGASYLIDQIRRRKSWVTAEATALLMVPLGFLGWAQAQGMASYSQTNYLIPVLRPLTAHGGRFLSDTARVDAYSLPAVPWNDWVKLQISETQLQTQLLAQQILHNQFTLIALADTKGRQPQTQLRALLAQDDHYTLISRVPSSGPGPRMFLVWKLSKGAAK